MDSGFFVQWVENDCHGHGLTLGNKVVCFFIDAQIGHVVQSI